MRCLIRVQILSLSNEGSDNKFVNKLRHGMIVMLEARFTTFYYHTTMDRFSTITEALNTKLMVMG